MSLGSRINEIRRKKGISIDDLSEKSGVPKGTLSKITAGITTSPTLDTVKAIARALDCRLDDLDDEIPQNKKIVRLPQRDEADEVADIFRKLDDHGKGAVRAILQYEEASYIAVQRQGKKLKPRSDGFVEIKVYDQPAAAGLGNYLDDPAHHMEQFPANVIPEGTEFGVRISGNSMAPNIPDGATTFVQSRSSIEPGKVGIFLLNEDSYCKKLEVDRSRQEVHLVSFNPEYEDRIIEECDDFRTMGLVLGWWPHG